MYFSKFTSNTLSFYHKMDPNLTYDSYKVHFHPHYEVILFVKGDCSFICDSNKYKLKKYDLLFIPPNVYHNIVFDSIAEYERFDLSFSPAIAEQCKRLLEYDTAKLFRFNSPSELLNLFQRLERFCLQLKEEEFIDVTQAILKELLYYIRSNEEALRLNAEELSYPPLLISILNYINENLFTIKNVTEINSSLYISYSYLIKIFKKYLKTSPKKYLTEKRLSEAHKLISQGEHPIAVYEKCGFETYTIFYKAYRSFFGYPPSQQEEYSLLRFKDHLS